MFSFTPFNWASSVILSKFLNPYFKELDDRQVDVGFLDGHFTLKNLQLRREVFLMNDVNLEVVDSLISQLKIKIPWKSIKTEPIELEISGLRLVISNKLDQSEEEKEEVKQKMHQIKIAALEQFEKSVDAFQKEMQKKMNKKDAPKTQPSTPFYRNWIQNISQNFRLKITDIEIVYIYHVTKYEVLKIGLNLDKIEVGTVESQFQKNNTFGSILKNLSLKNISIYFEFYNSFINTNFESKNFFDINAKKVGFFSQTIAATVAAAAAEPTQKKLKSSTKPNKSSSGSGGNVTQQESSDEIENYIIKDLNIEVLVKLDVFTSLQLELNVTIPQLTLFLKQNQMRLLLKSLNDLANFNQKRPTLRPNDPAPPNQEEENQLNPAQQWWKFAIDRVIETENLPGKVKQRGFIGFLEAVKYRKYYTKKKLNVKLKENEIKFFEKFEYSFPLEQVVLLRQMAINTIVEYRNKLASDAFDERNQAERWFSNFIPGFHRSKLSTINLMYIQDDDFDKSITNPTLEDETNSATGVPTQPNADPNNSENGKTKERSNKLPIIAEFNIGVFEILIEENQMLQDVKNLHHQASLFKEALQNKPRLKSQVLQHIKKNFISELGKKGIHQDQQEIEPSGLRDQNSKESDIQQGQAIQNSPKGPLEWNYANICKRRKILLYFQIEKTLMIFNQMDSVITQLQVDIKRAVCTDMFPQNLHYNKVLDIDQGIQFMMKTEIVKMSKIALRSSTEEKITHINIDANIPSVLTTFCKPFIERCSILMQVLLFDPEKSEVKGNSKVNGTTNNNSSNNAQQQAQQSGDYNFEKQQQYFGQFLQQKDKVNTFTNIAITAGKINVNLPLTYQVRDKMLVIQLKNCKLFKREHESLLEEGLNDRKKEFKTEGDILEPLLITIHCLKILIAQDFDWEDKQNVFLYNLKQNLHCSFHVPQHAPAPFKTIRRVQQNSNSMRDASDQNFFNKQRDGVEESTQIILETLPISVRMEMVYSSFQIGGVASISKSKDPKKIINLKKTVTPMSQRLLVNLPFFLVNVSVSQLQIFLYLAQVWSLEGYNLLNALQDQEAATTGAGISNLWGNEENEAPGMYPLIGGGINGSSTLTAGFGRGGEDQTFFQQQPNLHSSYQPNHHIHVSNLQQQHLSEWNRKKNIHIEQNIQYDDRILKFLHEHLFFEIDLRLEGLQVNLNLCAKESIKKHESRICHANEMLSLNLMGLRVLSQSYFFTSENEITLQTLLVENKNCCNFDLLHTLKQQATHNLSKSDYQIVMQDAYPLNQDATHFQSMGENEKLNADRFHNQHMNIKIDEKILNGSDLDMKDFVKQLEKEIQQQHSANNSQPKNKSAKSQKPKQSGKVEQANKKDVKEEEQEDIDEQEARERAAGEPFTFRETNRSQTSESFMKKAEHEKLMKSLMHFEEEHLLLNLQSKGKSGNEKVDPNGQQEGQVEKCKDCFDPNSKKKFLILNFMKRGDLNQFGAGGLGASGAAGNRSGTASRSKYEAMLAGQFNQQSQEDALIDDSQYEGTQPQYKYRQSTEGALFRSEEALTDENEYNEQQYQNEQDMELDVRITVKTIHSEFFIAKEQIYHDTIPASTQVFMNHPVLSVDPDAIAQIKNIFDVTSIYVAHRVADFKEFMASKGFSPYIGEDKEGVSGAGVAEKSGEQPGETTVNNKVLSELKVCVPSLTVTMLHNVPQKRSLLSKSLEPALLLYMSNLNLTQQARTAFTNLELISSDFCMYDISQETGLHTQALGNIQKPSQKGMEPEILNELSVEMKTFHSKELSALNGYSTYMGIKLSDAKIVFLKRTTTEIQVYIRKFLLESLKNRVRLEDIRFMREVSRKLIAERFDLFKADHVFPSSSNEPQNNQNNPNSNNNNNQQQQPNWEEEDSDPSSAKAEPSDMKMEIVVLNSIACAYRNGLSEKDGVFMRFSKMGYWFTGKWGQSFKSGGLIDTGLHTFEQASNSTTNNNNAPVVNVFGFQSQQPAQPQVYGEENGRRGSTNSFEAFSNQENTFDEGFGGHVITFPFDEDNLNSQNNNSLASRPLSEHDLNHNHDEFFDVISEQFEELDHQSFALKVGQTNNQRQIKPSSRNIFANNQAAGGQQSETPTPATNFDFIKKTSSSNNYQATKQFKTPEITETIPSVKNDSLLGDAQGDENGAATAEISGGKILEIQRIFMWDLEAFTSEEFQNKDLFLSTPPKVPSVEVKIIFDDPDFERWTFISDAVIPPMKIQVVMPQLNMYMYDRDYTSLNKFFQENLGETPRTVFLDQVFDIDNSTIWQFLDISVQRLVVKTFTGERDELEESLKRDFYYVHNDDFIDNDMSDIRLLPNQSREAGPRIYRSSWGSSEFKQSTADNHQRSNSGGVGDRTRARKSTRNQHKRVSSGGVGEGKDPNQIPLFPLSPEYEQFLAAIKQSQLAAKSYAEEEEEQIHSFMPQNKQSQQKKFKPNRSYKNIFIMMNPASLGEIVMENVVYHFYMKENGSKLMKVWATKFDISDFRLNSQLSQRQVMFDTQDWQAVTQQSNQQNKENTRGAHAHNNNNNNNNHMFLNNNDFGSGGGGGEGDNVADFDRESLNSDDLNINGDFDTEYARKYGDDIVIGQSDEDNKNSDEEEDDDEDGNDEQHEVKKGYQLKRNHSDLIPGEQKEQKQQLLQNNQNLDANAHGFDREKDEKQRKKKAKQQQKLKDRLIRKGAAGENIVNQQQNNNNDQVDRQVGMETDHNYEESDQILQARAGNNPEKLSLNNRKKLDAHGTNDARGVAAGNKQRSSGDSEEKPKEGLWERFKRSLFCCRRKKKINTASEEKLLQETVKEDEQKQHNFAREVPLKRELSTWPQDKFPRGRKWMIRKYKQCLPKTIPDTKREFLYQYEEMESQFRYFKSNSMYNYIGSEKDLEYNDLTFSFITQPDGEKLMKAHLKNKNFVFMNDFLMELIMFFRTPFNGSDDIKNKQQFREPAYNNYPAMTIKIKVDNFWMLILNSLKAPQNCLAVNLNADYLQEWIGDNNMGPGSALMDVNMELLKLTTCSVERIYGDKMPRVRKNFSSSTLKVLERFMGEIKEEEINSFHSNQRQPVHANDVIIEENHADENNHDSSSHNNYEASTKSKPTKQIGFFNKLSQKQSEMDENNEQLLQKALLQNDVNTNLIIPFKIRFKNSFVIDMYKLQRQYEANDPAYRAHILAELEEDNNDGEEQQNGLKQPNNQLDQSTKPEDEFTNQRIEVCVYNDKRKKFRNLNLSMHALKQIKDITANMMSPSTFLAIFQLDVVSTQQFKVKFMLPDHKSQFLAQNEPSNLLLPYTVTTRMSPEEIQRYQNQPVDKCFSVLRVKLKRFKIETFKNYFGNQTLKLKISNLIMKKITKQENSTMGLKGQLKIKYYNKRKGIYEPLLEPWTFHVNKLKVDSDSNLKVSNFDSNKLRLEQPKELESVQVHRNSLNINLSTAFIETAIEAANAFEQSHEHRDPYRIVNHLGYGVIFLTNDNKKILIEDLIQQLVSKNGEKDYVPHFKQQQDANDESRREHINKIKYLNVSFIILKPAKETQIQKKLKQYIDGLQHEMQRTNGMMQSTSNQQQLLLQSQHQNRMMRSTNQAQLPPSQQSTNSMNLSQSTFVLPDISGVPDRSKSGFDPNPPHLQDFKVKQKILISKNFSDFRTINSASLDKVGRQFFTLENLNAFGSAPVDRPNEEEEEHAKIEEKLRYQKNALSPSNEDFFVVNVTVEAGTGRKIVTIESAATFYNNLDSDIYICFLVERPQDLMQSDFIANLQKQNHANNSNNPHSNHHHHSTHNNNHSNHTHSNNNQANANCKEPPHHEEPPRRFESMVSYLIPKNTSFAIPLLYLQEKRPIIFKPYQKSKKEKAQTEITIEGEAKVWEQIQGFKVYEMEELIRAESIIQDYESVDDLKITDIIGLPNNLFANDKQKRLIHKQSAMVSYKIAARQIDNNKKNGKPAGVQEGAPDVPAANANAGKGSALAGLKKNNLLLSTAVQTLVNGKDREQHFQVSVIKTKQPVQNNIKNNNGKTPHYCYETSIVLNPFLRIVNATIETFYVEIGGQQKSLMPDDVFVADHFNLEACFSMKIGYDPFKMQEINPFKGKNKDTVRIDVNNSKCAYPVFLHLGYEKISKNCRLVTLYTPYVVFNRTGLDLLYKEYKKDLLYKDKRPPPQKPSTGGASQQALPPPPPSGGGQNQVIISQLHLTDAKLDTQLEGEESLLIFSPSQNCKRMEIAIASKNITWGSTPIVLQQKSQVEVILSKSDEKLYEVTVNIEPGKGMLSRTDIVSITPKYYFFNQTDYNIAISQSISKSLSKEKYFRLPKGVNRQFYWPCASMKKIVHLSFYSRDILGKDFQFSNPFKIDEINNFAVKVQYKDIISNRYKNRYITVSITLQNGVYCVRFLEKGQPPPYVILNKTSHEIFVQQYIPQFSTTCCNKRRRQLHCEKKVIFPKQRVLFTWDHWLIDFDKQLSVEIDTNQKVYNLEKLKDYEPIYLQKQDEKIQQKEHTPKRKILYRKGYLKICDNFKDQFFVYFCILNIYKQKLKLYVNDEKISTIDLVYAKLELKRGGFDIITSRQKRLNVKLATESVLKNNLYEWYLALYNSIQINMPDKVDFKIEPRNGTMEVTFYQQKKYHELKKSGVNRNGLLNFDEDGIPYQITRNNYELNIRNMIGISIIDDSTQELFSISLKNLTTIFQQEEKLIKDDDEIESVNPQQISIPSMQQLLIDQKSTNVATGESAEGQKQAAIGNNDQQQSQQQAVQEQQQRKQVVKNVTKTFLQFSLENIFINNQNIVICQYPVIFASDVKKSGENPPPFIFISAQWKNVKNVYDDIPPQQLIDPNANNNPTAGTAVSQGGGDLRSSMARSNSDNAIGDPSMIHSSKRLPSQLIPSQQQQLVGGHQQSQSLQVPQSQLQQLDSSGNIEMNRKFSRTQLPHSEEQQNLLGGSKRMNKLTESTANNPNSSSNNNNSNNNNNNNNNRNQSQAIQLNSSTHMTVTQPPLSQIHTVSLDDGQTDDLESAIQIVDGDLQQEQVVQWINNLQIYFDHFEIRIDTHIISTIMEFADQVNKALHSDSRVALQPVSKILQEMRSKNIDMVLFENFNTSRNNKKKAIYFKNLTIQPVNFCLTLNLTGGMNQSSSSSSSSTASDIQDMPFAIFKDFGLSLMVMNQANINLKALNHQHLYDTLPSIQSRIQKHYVGQFITELYKILGSFEVIGNPLKLVKDISKSVSQMIYDPLKSLAKGSGAQAVGQVATGAISFVSNSISGVYKAVRNITGFVMRVIAQITWHKQYQQDRSIRINRQIKNIEDGFNIGGKNFLLILWDTVYGPVYLPLEGCRNSHVLGFIKGAYSAFVSLFIKPIVGIYDFLISIFDGLFNSAVYEDHVMEYRNRPPRIFEKQKIENFEFKMAVGKDILRRLKQQPKSYEAIKYYDEIQVGTKKFLEIILTDIRLVCAKKNSPVDFQKVQLHKIKYIEYNKKKRQFRFYYDVPMKSFLRCCNSKNPYTQVTYEKYDSHEKALDLVAHLRSHFKQQKIPIKIVVLEA